MPPSSLPRGATLTRRFGVKQKGKVRPIDDYKASMVNASVTQTEQISVHSVDHIAAMISRKMESESKSFHCGRALVAKCWDLASAYKQVPLSDEAFEMDSYLVVFNPKTQSPEIYKQKVLPFGSIASVTGFLRCSSAVWHLGVSLLGLCWTAYFDDFLSLEACLVPFRDLGVGRL